MRLSHILFVCLFFTSSISSQEIIDGEVPFQNDPAKKFSLYIPQAYDEEVPNKLIIGFHPFNTSRWDAKSWRDTLQNFSESVNAIMLCPDGGLDGKVDDPIDTAFTSFILDSIRQTYNIDDTKIFAMGFSWGGRTTYTYGLNRPNLFEGHLVIGAAINGLNEIGQLIDNAENKSFYLVHGSNDAVSTRYTPAKTALENANACIEGELLQGVGHTIDFPNRNQILLDAFNWLENRACGLSGNTSTTQTSQVIYPNPSDGYFNVSNLKDYIIDGLYDCNGNLVRYKNTGNGISVNQPVSGLYFLRIYSDKGKPTVHKLLVL
jgi:predicted esterase